MICGYFHNLSSGLQLHTLEDYLTVPILQICTLANSPTGLVHAAVEIDRPALCKLLNEVCWSSHFVWPDMNDVSLQVLQIEFLKHPSTWSETSDMLNNTRYILKTHPERQHNGKTLHKPDCVLIITAKHWQWCEILCQCIKISQWHVEFCKTGQPYVWFGFAHINLKRISAIQTDSETVPTCLYIVVYINTKMHLVKQTCFFKGYVGLGKMFCISLQTHHNT